MSRPRVLLVEDGANSTAVQTVRPLAAAGFEVGIATPVPFPVAGASRAVSRVHRAPSPGAVDFAEAVARVVAEGSYDVVLGVGDAEVMALSAARERLGALFPYAPHDVVLRALDKAAMTSLAESCGVDVPVTVGPGDLDRLPPGPVIVKAAAHWTPGEASLRRPTLRFGSVDEARARLAELGDDVIVQQALPGDLTAYVAVRGKSGSNLGEVQQRGTRVWPAGAGNTARGFTVPVERSLADSIWRLLDALGWTGLAQFQFIEDASGAPRLIDLNGRCYGSLALATAAGVNLAGAWVADALGRSAPQGTARAGVRYQRLEDDLRRAVRAPDGPTDVLATLATAFVSTHGVWSPRDPRPSLRRARQLVARRGRKG
jgi:predicted ATP-grasp superfamily ATP-dependent carboligase